MPPSSACVETVSAGAWLPHSGWLLAWKIMPSMKASAATGMMMMGIRSALVPDISALLRDDGFSLVWHQADRASADPGLIPVGIPRNAPPSHPGAAPGRLGHGGAAARMGAS